MSLSLQSLPTPKAVNLSVLSASADFAVQKQPQRWIGRGPTRHKFLKATNTDHRLMVTQLFFKTASSKINWKIISEKESTDKTHEEDTWTQYKQRHTIKKYRRLLYTEKKHSLKYQNNCESWGEIMALWMSSKLQACHWDFDKNKLEA